MPLSVEEYHRMAEEGILNKYSCVELLDGVLVTNRKKHPPKPYCKSVLGGLLRKRIPDDWHIRMYAPITTDTSEPEPDLTVVSGSIDRYSQRHPSPDEIVLTVEIENRDWWELEQKVSIYARAGLSPLWIVRIPDQRVDVCSNPSTRGGGLYQSVESFTSSDHISVLLAGERLGELSVAEFLPVRK